MLQDWEIIKGVLLHRYEGTVHLIFVNLELIFAKVGGSFGTSCNWQYSLWKLLFVWSWLLFACPVQHQRKYSKIDHTKVRNINSLNNWVILLNIVQKMCYCECIEVTKMNENESWFGNHVIFVQIVSKSFFQKICTLSRSRKKSFNAILLLFFSCTYFSYLFKLTFVLVFLFVQKVNFETHLNQSRSTDMLTSIPLFKKYYIKVWIVSLTISK